MVPYKRPDTFQHPSPLAYYFHLAQQLGTEQDVTPLGIVPWNVISGEGVGLMLDWILDLLSWQLGMWSETLKKVLTVPPPPYFFTDAAAQSFFEINPFSLSHFFFFCPHSFFPPFIFPNHFSEKEDFFRSLWCVLPPFHRADALVLWAL